MKLTLTDDPTIALDKEGNEWYLSIEWKDNDPVVKWKRAKDEDNQEKYE